jgi:hypothetical protein
VITNAEYMLFEEWEPDRMRRLAALEHARTPRTYQRRDQQYLRYLVLLAQENALYLPGLITGETAGMEERLHIWLFTRVHHLTTTDQKRLYLDHLTPVTGALSEGERAVIFEQYSSEKDWFVRMAWPKAARALAALGVEGAALHVGAVRSGMPELLEGRGNPWRLIFP